MNPCHELGKIMFDDNLGFVQCDLSKTIMLFRNETFREKTDKAGVKQFLCIDLFNLGSIPGTPNLGV